MAQSKRVLKPQSYRCGGCPTRNHLPKSRHQSGRFGLSLASGSRWARSQPVTASRDCAKHGHHARCQTRNQHRAALKMRMRHQKSTSRGDASPCSQACRQSDTALPSRVVDHGASGLFGLAISIRLCSHVSNEEIFSPSRFCHLCASLFPAAVTQTIPVGNVGKEASPGFGGL